MKGKTHFLCGSGPPTVKHAELSSKQRIVKRFEFFTIKYTITLYCYVKYISVNLSLPVSPFTHKIDTCNEVNTKNNSNHIIIFAALLSK